MPHLTSENTGDSDQSTESGENLSRSNNGAYLSWEKINLDIDQNSSYSLNKAMSFFRGDSQTAAGQKKSIIFNSSG